MTYLSSNDINNITSNYDLNIFSCNILSFNKKYDQFQIVLKSLKFPEVIALSEVWQPYDEILCLENYHPPIVKLRSNNKAGGIAMWIKKHIKILKIDQLNHLNLRYVEANSVYIQVQKKKFTIVNLYRAPNKPAKDTIEELNTIFNYFNHIDSTIIYNGDTNIDLLKPEKPLAVSYYDLMSKFFLEQCITTPTRLTHNTISCIDHVFTNKPFDIEAHVLDISLSEHQTIMMSTLVKKSNETLQSFPERKNIKIASSISAIENNIDWIDTCEKIEKLDSNDGLQLLMNLINNNVVTMKTKQKRTLNKKPWFNSEAYELNSKVMKEKRKFLNSRTLRNENSYKKLRKDYNKFLQKLKANYYHREIFLAQGDGRKVWKTINQVLNRKQIGPNDHEKIVLRDENGEICSDQTKVANIFNEFYVNFAPDLAKTIPKSDTPAEDLVLNTPQPDDTFSFKEITTDEIQQIIKDLQPKNSSGFDSIPNRLTKGLINCISEPLKIIINKSFKEGKFPSCIKIAKLSPLFKAGDKKEASNYRPINQLSSLSKIIEKACLNQTKNHRKKFISNRQFGFLENHSTLIPICLTLDYIQKQHNKLFETILICLDLRKAFDVVNVKDILPKKLAHYKFDDNSINWITSFFTDRQQYVQLNDIKSDTKKLRDISVTQGSRMGPDHFNIFINDLPDNTGFESFLFADDTNFLLSDKNLTNLEIRANHEFNRAQKYLEANQLSLNLEKTQYMIFKSKKTTSNKNFELKSGNHIFNEVNEIKFLGITIPTDLKFKTHYEKVINKMKSGIAAINHVKKLLPTQTKLQIFNALVKSHYEYCAMAWIPSLTKNQIQKIVKLQKHGLRLVYLTHKLAHSAHLFIKSNITRFDLLFKKTVIELFHKKYLGILPKMISDKLDEFEKSKNPRTKNLKIPNYYKKGNLFFEILNVWNNLPENIKNPPKKLFISKKRINEFIKKEYILCELKNCKSCQVTPFEDLMNPLNELITALNKP